jgi:hypothetical protein
LTNITEKENDTTQMATWSMMDTGIKEKNMAGERNIQRTANSSTKAYGIGTNQLPHRCREN